MTGFDTGDIFLSKSDDSGSFHHYDADGHYLGTVATTIFAGPPSNGFGGTVRYFAQWRGYLYIINDYGGGNAPQIQEHSATTGAFSRIVVSTIDDTDPLQNPDSLTATQLFIDLFTLDTSGNIYATAQGDPNDRVWMWNNAGVFQKTFIASGSATNALLSNPQTPCEIISVNNTGSPSIDRNDACLETHIATITPPEGGSAFNSAFHTNGQFYKVIGGPPGTPAIRIYANGWGSSADTNVTLPTGFVTSDMVRPTTDADVVWLFSRPATSGATSQNFSMYRLKVSTNAIEISPVSLTSNGFGIEDGLVWLQSTTAPSRVWGIVIG